MKRSRILLVDNESEFLVAMKENLEEAGFDVSVAVGGAQGIQEAIAGGLDLVISDMRMDDVNGVELLQKLKAEKVPTRFMFMTAYDTDVRSTINFIKLGACSVLHKEFDSTELVAEVKRVLALDDTLASDDAKNESRVAERALLERSLRQAQLELQEVKSQTSTLVRQQSRHAAAIKILFLLAASAVTILFYRIGMIKSGYSLGVLPGLLFVLLSLPFDRIKTFITKLKKAEGRATFK